LPTLYETSSGIKNKKAKTELELLNKREFSGHDKLGNAIRDLISVWGVSFEDRETNSCGLSEKIGLRCAKFLIDLDQILKIDRPFVVSLNQEFFTVARANRETFFLFAGEKEYQLSFSEFSQMFDGNIDLIWRMPPNYNGPIGLYADGPAVDWLSIQLALVNEETPPIDKNVIFSEEMSKKVKRFQKLSGLSENGVVDALTWIHLNSYNSQSVPKLSY
jgi:general secretion pathway protein A